MAQNPPVTLINSIKALTAASSTDHSQIKSHNDL